MGIGLVKGFTRADVLFGVLGFVFALALFALMMALLLL